MVPLALFLDGVRYTSMIAGRAGTVLGFCLTNLVTEKRYWVGGVRSGDTCRCGCRGWCTLFPLLNSLKWMIAQLAQGKRFDRRHDGSAYDADDPLEQIRRTKGDRLGFRAAVIWVKGDQGTSPNVRFSVTRTRARAYRGYVRFSVRDG